MKIVMTIVLEPHDVGGGSGGGAQVTLEVERRQPPSRHRWSMVDEATWAGDALNSLAADGRAWIARRRGGK